MPENLRITAPIPNSDGILKPNPSAQSPAVEPLDPNRVNRPNTQGQNTDSTSLNLLLTRDSVFGEFIQQLRQTPALSETLGKMLLNAIRRLEASSGSLPEEGILHELATNLLKEQGDLVDNLILQQKSNTVFSGPLFQLLDRASEQAGDLQLDLRIASFLKAFDGFSSIDSTTSSILANLDAIGRRIPTGEAQQLALLSEKLNTTDPTGAVNHNLAILKKEILPFLSAYISKSGDYGKIRETISLLLQNLSILNISSPENLEAQFQQLVSYMGRHVEKPTLDMMRSFYAETIGDEKKQPENHFFHSLLHLLSHGMGQDTPEADRAMYEDICRSLLLDQSVYMPFTHIFLPAVLQGKFLFSQIWIEKKDDRNTSSTHSTAGAAPTQLYLTFEIQDLGYFEARVKLTGKNIDFALSCPEKLLGQSRAITSSLAQILTKNGFTFGDIHLSRCDKPEIPNLIVQKALERRQMVDVTI